MTATPSAAETLANFASTLTLKDIPQEVLATAKRHLIDTIGVGLAGCEAVGPKATRGLVEEIGGPGGASVWGEARRIGAPYAALINGACAHALDFDDSHATSVLHPSAPLVPALLAQGEVSGVTGEELLVSLVAAYEVVLRLGMAQYDTSLRNSVFFERGLHATSILGAVAGAALVARLRGLPAKGIGDALAIACSFGSGIIEANRAGGSVKQVHCGWAAHAAISAATLAAHGLTGPRSVLEGRYGLFQDLCGDRWSEVALTEGLGETWLTPQMGIKPYPCNMFTHSIIDAAVILRDSGIRPENVVSVEIGTAAASARTIGEPLAEKQHPQTPYHAAFSAPYVFASALMGGDGLGVGLLDFTELAFRDETRIALAEKCVVVADPVCTEAFPHHMSGVVTVQLVDGTTVSERVTDARGTWRQPLTDMELSSKLLATAGPRAAAISAAVATLEDDTDLARLVAACS